MAPPNGPFGPSRPPTNLRAMTIALECDCGKAVKVSDALAGKRMKCPACGANLTVPAALPPPPDEANDDFEVLDDDTPLPAKPVRLKAALAEEVTEEPAPKAE